MNKDNEINRLVRRLRKIGIELELIGNVPWIYLDKINGVKVTEKFQANHGFTIGWLGVKPGDEPHLSDITEVFNLIRKYVKLTNPWAPIYAHVSNAVQFIGI